MHKEAVKVAAGLLALGIEPGDRVAVWGPNQPEWLVMVSLHLNASWSLKMPGLGIYLLTSDIGIRDLYPENPNQIRIFL